MSRLSKIAFSNQCKPRIFHMFWMSKGSNLSKCDIGQRLAGSFEAGCGILGRSSGGDRDARLRSVGSGRRFSGFALDEGVAFRDTSFRGAKKTAWYGERISSPPSSSVTCPTLALACRLSRWGASGLCSRTTMARSGMAMKSPRLLASLRILPRAISMPLSKPIWCGVCSSSMSISANV